MTYFCSALCRLSCSYYGNGWRSWSSYGKSNFQEVWLLNINHYASYSLQRCKIIIVKKTITRNCTQYCLAWVLLPFVHVVKLLFVSCVLLLVLSCLLCNFCRLTVCIVVVGLCVILSYVYLLYCVGVAFFLL